ncbi:hypothetical protein [Synechococcus sp. WH 8016]|nr:hypothetical protein [Synechococcus sp. WH 8016]EHA62520.1 hypothetical protein Syn8016DRAFT_1815 [Synechococcus sp. WH 8016]
MHQVPEKACSAVVHPQNESTALLIPECQGLGDSHKSHVGINCPLLLP